MILRILSFFILSFSFSVGLAAEPANLRTTIIKMSKALRGTPLSRIEVENMERAFAKGKQEEFFREKRTEFLQSKLFDKQLKYKMDELFRVKTDEKPDSTMASDYSDITKYADSNSAMDNLFKDVIKNNRRWDELLTAKTYRFLVNDNAFSGGYLERKFYDGFLKTEPAKQTLKETLAFVMYDSNFKENTVTFPENDSRIAGVLTTQKFLKRYGNTALNKNRRRAAAVFRIFLCDSMVAAVPAKTDSSEKVDFDTIFPAHQSVKEDEISKAVRNADPHGAQKDCMACHYKLDPMGKVFSFSNAGLGPTAAPGALAFASATGKKVDIPVSGAAELGQRIVERREYVSCQVNHFWNWYIGSDAPKSAVRQNELIAKFEEVGRKPKDFISYLVETPEFRSKPEILNENQILARRAGAILKNCNDCHGNLNKGTQVEYWDFTDLPFPKEDQYAEFVLGQMSWMLDIKGGGSKRMMPPKDSMWQLSVDEYQILKDWFKAGAPDYSGKAQQ